MSTLVRPLILTRPEKQLPFWSAAFDRLHIRTVALPLIEIAPTIGPSMQQARTQALEQLDRYQAIMHVSPNAVQFFWDQSGLAQWQQIAMNPAKAKGQPPRLWSPGPGTSQALQNLGFTQAAIDQPAPVHASQFDSEALWTVVHKQITLGSRVLVVRGSSESASDKSNNCNRGSGRDWLAQTLGNHGAEVDFICVYERRPPRWQAHQAALVTLAENHQFIWLFSSSEAVSNLTTHYPAHHWRNHSAIATHPRIAHTLLHAGFGQVVETRPTPEAIAAAAHAMQAPSAP
ncbi:uroporphyrinogen-III synthase [Lampropedia puyangensis]|uniref:Uroporphyrinogen-III synthase n=1 Tax=Lampropedia puyangensis TaxID=1330072 RepID=A0A4S8FCU5_9BURK|nr:uroporphyrinogen-III synthase [Lampropedia puyangensis]THU05408.1 uroporphyrinogen-III synthase [Lampropedia puyangensis]